MFAVLFAILFSTSWNSRGTDPFIMRGFNQSTRIHLRLLDIATQLLAFIRSGFRAGLKRQLKLTFTRFINGVLGESSRTVTLQIIGARSERASSSLAQVILFVTNLGWLDIVAQFIEVVRTLNRAVLKLDIGRNS